MDAIATGIATGTVTATPNEEAPVSDQPTPEEAARALRDADRNSRRALGLMVAPRWVHVLFGVLICADLASQDVAGKDVSAAVGLLCPLLLIVYVVLSRTRRGSLLVGQSVPRRVISRPFALAGRTLILVVMAAGVAAALSGTRLRLHLPYWHTILGAVLGLTLAVFGPSLSRALLSSATAHLRNHPGVPDGSR